MTAPVAYYDRERLPLSKGWVEKLPPQTQRRLRSALNPKWSEYIPHTPHPKQHAAMLLDQVREVFYGGAAGGGKSDYLLFAALQYVDVPGYSALILRRTFPQLSQSDGLMPRAEEWLESTDARGTDRQSGYPVHWRFPSGATLTFGHCQHPKDWQNYQGGAYQFLGFDELTQFPERIYLTLLSRLRRLEKAPVPLRARSASNPGGDGHDWVKARFVTPMTRDPQRVFLRALLDDNPSLDQVEYEKTLMLLHPYEREQMLKGNWDVRPPGGKFKREWFQIIDVLPGNVVRLVRYWDLASTEQAGGNDPDFTAGVKMGLLGDGRYVVVDCEHFRATPGTVENRVHQTAQLDGHGVDVYIEVEGGSAGKFTIAHFIKQMAGYPVHGHRPTGPKLTRMNPFASQAEAGNVLVVNGPWVEPFLRELEMIDAGASHDDQGDAAAGAFEKLTRGGGEVLIR